MKSDCEKIILGLGEFKCSRVLFMCRSWFISLNETMQVVELHYGKSRSENLITPKFQTRKLFCLLIEFIFNK